MPRKGYLGTDLLDELHAEGCRHSRTFTKCQPVVVPPFPEAGRDQAAIEIVLMEWCSECGAADWEVV